MKRTLPLALLTLALAACTSNGDAGSSATATTEATPTVQATSTAIPTTAPTVIGADPTSALDPNATPRPNAPAFRSWIVDAATGDAAPLGDDSNSFLLLHGRFQPLFTPDGAAVWLSRQGWSDARRYGLDGTLPDAIEGAYAVEESPDGSSRVYFLRGDDFTRMLVEHGDAVIDLDGRNVLPRFSPDGRSLAYYAVDDTNTGTLMVLDVESGVTRVLAEDVDPCPCDLTPRPDWSPSGTHIAYYDYSENDTDSPLGSATYLVRADGTGEPLRLAGDASPARAPGWIADGSGGERLILTDFGEHLVSLFDLASGQEVPLFNADEDERLSYAEAVGGSFVQVSSVVIAAAEPQQVTRLFDGATGEQLARWDAAGEAAATPDGPALAASLGNSDGRGCLGGTLVFHPALAEPQCLPHATDTHWSPDGTRLATAVVDDDGLHISIWTPTDGLRELAVVPSRASLIEWNPQGTHILVSDRAGI